MHMHNVIDIYRYCVHNNLYYIMWYLVLVHGVHIHIRLGHNYTMYMY